MRQLQLYPDLYELFTGDAALLRSVCPDMPRRQLSEQQHELVPAVSFYMPKMQKRRSSWSGMHHLLQRQVYDIHFAGAVHKLLSC